MDAEFQELSNLEEKLKEALDSKDIRNIKQKNWLLKQQQNDLKYQLTGLIFQFEEKLALWEHFDTRYTFSRENYTQLQLEYEKF